MKAPAVSTVSVVLLLGCGESPTEAADPFVERAIPADLQADAAAVAAANNAFAFDLYHALSADATGNLFFSPFSISTALTMTLAGAAGGTEREMTETLQHTLDRGALHPAYGAMLESLDRGSALPGYTLSTANALWCQDGMGLLNEFRGITTDDYHAPARTADFSGAPEASRQQINGWVKGETHGKIEDLFPAGSIDNLTRLVLANAIYFKGRWQVQFDPGDTRPADFWVSKDQSRQVPIMYRKLDASIARVDGAAVLDLPYSGGDLSMLFVLPDERDGLDAVAAGLDAARLAEWIEALETREDWEIYIPRFHISWDKKLNETLAGLGMPSAFEDLTADFSRISDDANLVIQSVVHKAFVDVNEEGTEAAAATGVGVGITSLPPSFRADHPFLFLIRDHVTGAVLFLGRVVDPAS